MKDWIEFRAMWTPTLIQMVFIIGSGLLAFLGVREMINGAERADRLIGLSLVLLGPILLRLYCEWFIVVFKIHEVLEEVLEELVDQRPSDETVPLDVR